MNFRQCSLALFNILFRSTAMFHPPIRISAKLGIIFGTYIRTRCAVIKKTSATRRISGGHKKEKKTDERTHKWCSKKKQKNHQAPRRHDD